MWWYKLADFDTANNLLDSIDWDNLLSGDINQAWENWKKTYVMEQCIPYTSIKTKRNLPWINIDLTKSLRSRNLAYKKAKQTNNPNYWNTYKKKWNEVAN